MADAPCLVELPEGVTLEDVAGWLDQQGYTAMNAVLQRASYDVPLPPAVHRALVAEYGLPPVPTERPEQLAVLTTYEAHNCLRLWPFYRGVDYSALRANTTRAELRAHSTRYERQFPLYHQWGTTPPLSNTPTATHAARRDLARDLYERERILITRGGTPPPTTKPRRPRPPETERPRRRLRAAAPSSSSHPAPNDRMEEVD